MSNVIPFERRKKFKGVPDELLIEIHHSIMIVTNNLFMGTLCAEDSAETMMLGTPIDGLDTLLKHIENECYDRGLDPLEDE